MHKIGRYEIITELGRGAMGVVYRARDSEIGRTVALKVVLTANASAQDVERFKQRFHREAQAAGRLSHPGIVTIHDIAEDETGQPYIVMEFVEGRPLNLLLGPTSHYPLEQLLDLGIQVAQALDYAHKNGVVHRDIKPPNILVTPDGRAKIADFGIARLEGTELTQEGTSVGTPSYMSPEQFRGGAVDGRSDIFSLGAVLYWMCTGKKPFPGENITITSFQVAYENPPPPSTANINLPEALDDVLMRCLAKNPESRYATAGDLAADLDAVKGGRPLPTLPGFHPERTEPFPLPSRKLDSLSAQSAPAEPAANPEEATRVAAPHEQLGAPRLESASRLPQFAWAAVAFVVVLLVMTLLSRWLERRTLPVQQSPAAATESAPTPDSSAVPAPQPAPAVSTPPENSAAASAPANTPPSATAARKKPAPSDSAAAKSSGAAAPNPTTAASAAPLVTLEVLCKFPFKQATLEVYDGDRLLLHEKLEGKRRGITLGITASGEYDNKDVSIPAGEHTFRVRITTKEGAPVWEGTATGVLAEGIHDELEITFKNSDNDPGGRNLVVAVHHPD